MRTEHHLTDDRRGLPLAAHPERTKDGAARSWTIRLPVRAEQVTVNKQIMVTQEARLRVNPTERRVTIDRPTKRERLRVDLAGDLRATTEE